MSVATFELKIASVVVLTPEVSAFRLVEPQGADLPQFKAGAHIDVHLEAGLVRQYSICSVPSERNHYWIAVKREEHSRGGSLAIHRTFKIGELVTVGPPRNAFGLAASAESHILFAGGIGITPLLCMARELEQSGREYHLHYFVRSLDSAAFGDVLADELRSRVSLHVGLDAGGVRRSIAHALDDRSAADHIYCCGPAPFMTTVKEEAARIVAADQIHSEHFAAITTESGDTRPFKVILTSTGRSFEVPADKSILEVLEENGIPCDASCREGVCGSCMVSVAAGEIEHRDHYLSDQEKGSGEVMMICVSRAKNAEITIEL